MRRVSEFIFSITEQDEQGDREIISGRNKKAKSKGYKPEYFDSEWKWVGLRSERVVAESYSRSTGSSNDYETDKFDRLFDGKRFEIKGRHGNYQYRKSYSAIVTKHQLRHKPYAYIFCYYYTKDRILRVCGWITYDSLIKDGKKWEKGQKTPFGFTASAPIISINYGDIEAPSLLLDNP